MTSGCPGDGSTAPLSAGTDGDGAVVDDAGVERTIEFAYGLTGVGSTDVAEPAWFAEATASA